MTNISRNILYIVGTVKKPPAISGEYYYLCFTVSRHLYFPVPGTLYPARSHAASARPPTMQSQV